MPRDTGRYAAAIITLAYAGFAFYFLKKMPMSSVHRRAVLFIVSLMAVLYVAAALLSGFRFGFFLADVPISFRSLYTYILPFATTIVATEIIRGALLGQKGKASWIFAYAIGLLSEVLMQTTFAHVTSFNRFMDLAGMALLPAATAQALYQYTGKHYGALPAIVYRLIVTVSPYLIPIKSGIPDSLASFIALLVPPIVLFLLRLFYGKSVKTAEKKRLGKWLYATIASSLLFVISFIMLISCEFRYGLLIIATESMTGELNKGDAAIYEQYTDQFIEEDDILVFDKDGRVTVHRVIDIARVNGKNRYFTKGDANDDADYGYITDESILGVVEGKLPYFGYPTLFLRELFQR